MHGVRGVGENVSNASLNEQRLNEQRLNEQRQQKYESLCKTLSSNSKT